MWLNNTYMSIGLYSDMCCMVAIRQPVHGKWAPME